MAKFILNEIFFCYVPQGQWQSDAIEKTFGWYRQLNRANYFVSVCQVLDSKKSIRVKSLIKFSDFNISEAKSVLTEIPDDKEANLTPELEELLSVLNSDDLLTKCESPEDKNCTAFTERSISNQVKCDDCNDLDTSPDEFISTFLRTNMGRR